MKKLSTTASGVFFNKKRVSVIPIGKPFTITVNPADEAIYKSVKKTVEAVARKNPKNNADAFAYWNRNEMTDAFGSFHIAIQLYRISE